MCKVDLFVLELNLLLPSFGLSVMYLPTPDPARWPSITKQVLLWS